MERAQETEAFARFHEIVFDQPLSEGGTDSGMTLPELMPSALGWTAEPAGWRS